MTTPSTSVGSTTGHHVTGMYYEFSIPLGLANLIEEVVAANPLAPNQPVISGGTSTNRQWFSQPRPGNDNTTEVLTAIFKQPLSVSELGFQALRVSCKIEVWYQDVQNNWRQMLNSVRMPVTVTLSTSAQGSWYNYQADVYPIIAKAVQIRLTRTYDPAVGIMPYVVGLQQVLIRRDVYGRDDGKMPLTDTQDALGNTISSYIKDWDAGNAIDDNPHTYWRSAPQPDPNAVANLYLDLRMADGSPQLIDTLYLDPVYTNQNLNLYYSNDDTTGPLKLSPISLPPDVEENTDWASGTGLSDTSNFGDVSAYQFPLALGPMVNQNAWIGVEWAPDFSPVATNAIQTVTLARATSGTFTLVFAAQVAGPIAYNAAPADVEEALEALPAIGEGNVIVTGATGGPWVVTFTNGLGGIELSTMGSNAGGLNFGATVTVKTVADGGLGGAPPQNPVLFGVNPGVNTVQTVTLTGEPGGGGFALTYIPTPAQAALGAVRQTTPVIDYNADANDVWMALASVPEIGEGNVLVEGTPGGPWMVTFIGLLGLQDVPTMSWTSELIGGANPNVLVQTTTEGISPPAPGGSQYWPTIYYDAGAVQVVLELSNGITAQTYAVPLSPLPTQYRPLRIVAGWSYASSGAVLADTVTVSVASQGGAVLGSLTATPGNLPRLITFDGENGFTNFRGAMTATIVKLEDASMGRVAFQANPAMYCFPAPVIPLPDGTIPSTTLDNAVFAAAWTLQEFGTGGPHESIYTNKTWTPIWQDYVTQKGKLFLPQATSMKYLKLEFSGLTEEAYPVYDTGINVSYLVFPVSVTAQASVHRSRPGLVGVVSGLLNMGAGVLQGIGTGSVNWLNPSTVQRAVSSAFTPVTQTVMVTAGPGYVTGTLPGTAQTSITDTTRTEAGSPWVYRRPMLDANTLANHLLNSINGTATIQNVSSTLDPVSGAVTTSFSTGPPGIPTATQPSLPIQGNDVWVFPGGTLRMPAAVMNGVLGSTQVVCGRKHTREIRYRFSTACIHRYDIRTVTLDAGLAYFAGVREVQALATSYIDELDPVSFTFSSYDPSQWVPTNTRALDTGPTSTAGKIFSVDNGDFDIGLGEWTAESGTWTYDGSQFGGYMYPGAAVVTANGSQALLASPEIVAVGATQDLVPGDVIDFSTAVRWSNLVVTNDQPGPQMAIVELFDGEAVRTTVIAAIQYADWTTHTSSSSSMNNYTTFSGTWTVPENVNGARVAFIMTSYGASGSASFDFLRITSGTEVSATLYKDLTTTSDFAKITAEFFDSGPVRSDSMWAQLDPNDTNISSSALAYYTNTIPDVIPSGTWADTFATWADPNVAWGEPRAVVSINVDPNRIYQGQRVLHFTRAAGAEEAGIKVRQWTNWVPNGLARISATWLKPRVNTNTITMRLRRMFDGVYIYEQAVTPAVGYWQQVSTHWFEIPDSPNQTYTVELVLTGDDVDELYLSDLWCDIAQVRYFCQLGGASAFMHDVTSLAYSSQAAAIVSATQPVNELVIQAAILSPKVWLYGARLTPQYLK